MTSTLEDPPAPLDPGVPGVLEAMRRQVRDLAETLWAARPAQELTRTVTSIEALKSTLEAVELDVIAELGATAGVRDEGWASTRDFVTAVAGGHHGTGPRLVRLAEDLTTDIFGPVAVGLRDGWLSAAKAVAITRPIDALPSTSDRQGAVALMLEEAKRLNASELAKAGRHLLSVIDPEGDDRHQERELDREDRAAHLHRFLSVTDDHGARLLDALIETCRRMQTADLLPHQHGAQPRLTLLMNHADLLAGLGVGVTEDGTEIAASAVRRLCCDAEVIPTVLGSTGEVLDVGRSNRLVTPPIWKALVARDRHCRFPGCRRPPLMCHAHHVWHWIEGGPTNLDNLILLCGHHHRLVHSGPWRVELDPTGVAAFDPPSGTTRERLVTPRPPPLE